MGQVPPWNLTSDVFFPSGGITILKSPLELNEIPGLYQYWDQTFGCGICNPFFVAPETPNPKPHPSGVSNGNTWEAQSPKHLMQAGRPSFLLLHMGGFRMIPSAYHPVINYSHPSIWRGICTIWVKVGRCFILTLNPKPLILNPKP